MSESSKKEIRVFSSPTARGVAERGAALAVTLALFLPLACSKDTDGFSPEEWERVKLIQPLSTPQPANPYDDRADDPDVAKFGQKLFWDKDFNESITVAGPTGNVGDVGKVSCATCHGSPYFVDARPFPQSHGRNWLQHNSPSMLNLGYNNRVFWTGRFDSMAEHGASALGGAGSTLFWSHVLYKKYRAEYDALFPEHPLPAALDPTSPDASHFPATGNQKASPAAADGAFDKMTRADQWELHWVRAQMGKVFDAYPRALVTHNSPFERYIAGERDDKVFSGRAKNGLKLFIGKASCIDCHNGPMLSDGLFHNVGVQDLTALPTGSTTVVAADRGHAGVLVTALNNAIFLNRTNRAMDGMSTFMKTDQWPIFSGAGQFSASGDAGLDNLVSQDAALCETRGEVATTCGLLFKAPKPEATPPDPGDPRYQVCMDANSADGLPGSCTKYKDSEEGVFKTPQLLNVAMTGPYFHTGEVKSLWDVVQHYNQGGGAPGTFVGVKSPRLRPLFLTDTEIDDLVEFLRTLTGELPPKDLTCNPLVDPLIDMIRGCGPPGAGAATGGASGTAGASGGGGKGGGGATGAGGGSGAGTGGMGMSSSGGAPASGGAPGSAGSGVGVGGAAAGGSAGGGG